MQLYLAPIYKDSFVDMAIVFYSVNWFKVFLGHGIPLHGKLKPFSHQTIGECLV